MSTERKFVFEPATLTAESLLIGLAGGTGSGKTFTAMRLATGLAGGKRFAVIDTENRRANHYARQFAFDRTDLTAPFRPDAYRDAILAAARAGYGVIVVDSMSHEWEGEGGILEWQEEELDRMAGTDYSKRESCKQAAWIQPKRSHKKMVNRLLQIRAHIILCFRAEEKTEMQRDPQTKKMKMVPKASPVGLNGWIPICDKRLPFELTASFLLTNDAPGVPKPIKLEEQHRQFFPPGQPITEKAGQQFGAWAKGDASDAGEVDVLLRAYGLCDDEPSWAALEERRGVIWKDKQTPAGQKARLKEVSEAARLRIEEAKKKPATTNAGEPLTPTEWEAALRAFLTDGKPLADLDAAWQECTQAFGGMVPMNVEDAYNMTREQLVERDARAEDY